MGLQLNGASTLMIALATILLGRTLNQFCPPLARSNIPPAASAGRCCRWYCQGRALDAGSTYASKARRCGTCQ